MMKTIALTQGKVAIVDDEDFEELSKYKWCYSSCGYAKRTLKNIRMHKVIMNAGDRWVDHINGDRLDNRKENLRFCNKIENQRNRKLGKNNTSGYKGLLWREKRNRWEVYISINKKQTYIGMFKEKKDAAEAYNKAAKIYYGDFAKLNIIK